MNSTISDYTIKPAISGGIAYAMASYLYKGYKIGESQMSVPLVIAGAVAVASVLSEFAQDVILSHIPNKENRPIGGLLAIGTNAAFSAAAIWKIDPTALSQPDFGIISFLATAAISEAGSQYIYRTFVTPQQEY